MNRRISLVWDFDCLYFNGYSIIKSWLILIVIFIKILVDIDKVCMNMIIGYMGLENI